MYPYLKGKKYGLFQNKKWFIAKQIIILPYHEKKLQLKKSKLKPFFNKRL